MKNKAIKTTLVIICAVILVSCAENSLPKSKISAEDITVGMSQKEVHGIIDDQKAIYCCDHCFFIDRNERDVIVSFAKESVNKIETFSRTIPSDKDFDKIDAGMSVYDLVRLVGVPCRSAAFGLIALDFFTLEGNTYRVSLGYASPANSDIEVIEVRKV